MIVTIKFCNIQVNTVQGSREIVFPYDDKWYRMDWVNVPEQYKIMYVAWLKFQGIEIPEDLKQYGRDTIDLSNLNIEIDLAQCVEVPEDYPLGG